MGIGKHLERRLAELGWDQKRLVTESKLGQQTVSAIITRDSVRSRFTPHLAATVFLSTDQLITGIWPKYEGKPLAVAVDNKTRDREQLLFALIRSLTPEQQEDLLPPLRAAHEANTTTKKHVGAILRTIGNARMEKEYGTTRKKIAAKIVSKPVKPKPK